MNRDKSAFDFAIATARPGDQLIGDPYLAAIAFEDRIEPFLRPVREQHPLQYPDSDPVRELPAQGDIDMLEGVDVAGWPALIAGLYP